MSYMRQNFRLSRIEFIRSKHSNFSAHVSGVSAAAAAGQYTQRLEQIQRQYSRHI